MLDNFWWSRSGMHNHWLYYIRYVGAFFAIGGSVLLLAVAVKAWQSPLIDHHISEIQSEIDLEGLHGLPDRAGQAEGGGGSSQQGVDCGILNHQQACDCHGRCRDGQKDDGEHISHHLDNPGAASRLLVNRRQRASLIWSRHPPPSQPKDPPWGLLPHSLSPRWNFFHCPPESLFARSCPSSSYTRHRSWHSHPPNKPPSRVQRWQQVLVSHPSCRGIADRINLANVFYENQEYVRKHKACLRQWKDGEDDQPGFLQNWHLLCFS